MERNIILSNYIMFYLNRRNNEEGYSVNIWRF